MGVTVGCAVGVAVGPGEGEGVGRQALKASSSPMTNPIGTNPLRHLSEGMISILVLLIKGTKRICRCEPIPPVGTGHRALRGYPSYCTQSPAKRKTPIAANDKRTPTHDGLGMAHICNGLALAFFLLTARTPRTQRKVLFPLCTFCGEIRPSALDLQPKLW
jgi:hypothetical protein